MASSFEEWKKQILGGDRRGNPAVSAAPPTEEDKNAPSPRKENFSRQAMNVVPEDIPAIRDSKQDTRMDIMEKDIKAIEKKTNAISADVKDLYNCINQWTSTMEGLMKSKSKNAAHEAKPSSLW